MSDETKQEQPITVETASTSEETTPSSNSEKGNTGEEMRILQEKIAELSVKIAEQEDQMKRQQADFQNSKRRQMKEREELLKYSAADVLKDLLPIIDNFDRALSATTTVDEGKGNKAFVEGVQMIRTSLQDLLKKHYVQETSTVGASFEPDLHSAIASEEAEDVAHEVIHEVYEKGYRHHDRTLRVATVKIKKPKSSSNSESTEKQN